MIDPSPDLTYGCVEGPQAEPLSPPAGEQAPAKPRRLRRRPPLPVPAQDAEALPELQPDIWCVHDLEV